MVSDESLLKNVNSYQSLERVFPRGKTSQGKGESKLDTSYRIIHNKIRFTPVENIDRNIKFTNREALKYYVNEKINEIKKSLIVKLYNEYALIDYPELKNKYFYDFNDIPKNLPLEITEGYNRGIIEYKNTCLLDYAEKTFFSYIKKLEKTSRYLYLTNNVTGDKDFKRLITRYSEVYRKKIVKRMNWLMWKYGNENCCLLTLTIDPKKYGYDKFDMWVNISKKYEVFIDKLKIYFKRHKRPFPSYLFGIESMFGRKENNYISRGNPHLHVCFFNCKYVAPVKTLEKYWGQGFVKINSTVNNEKVRYPIHYITKYITETFTINSPDNTLIQSLTWLFNKHSFDHSSGLVLPLNPKGCGDWSLNGIVYVPSLCDQLTEMIVIRDFVKVLCGGFKTPPPLGIANDTHI